MRLNEIFFAVEKSNVVLSTVLGGTWLLIIFTENVMGGFNPSESIL